MKRKREQHEEVVDIEGEVIEGERFQGYIHEIMGDKMFVTCDEGPSELPKRPPKITHKSKAPAGLSVGSWITFELLDEWPGENWGSLLAINIEPMDAPDGFVSPTPKAAGKPKANERKVGIPATRASLAAAVEKLRAASRPAKPAAKMPVVEQKAATKMPVQRSVVSKIPVVERPAKMATASIPRVTGGGETGLTKSSAVAAFRQAKETGSNFESGWRQPEKTMPKQRISAWKGKDNKEVNVEELPPFQKAFLEAPEELGEGDANSMLESRGALDLSVEMPSQIADVFPPITSFEDLQGILPDYAFQALPAMGIEAPMPIQAQAIPIALAGLDVVGIARTGSGKTLAYVLPALSHVEAQAPKAKGAGTPMVLILAPTRELAVQISDMVKAVTGFSTNGSNHPGGLTSAVLYGGGHGSKGWQVADCRKGGQILAATPGRLLDVMDSGEVSLERVTFFVLDEADRMLECGFEEQVGRIGRTIRRDRHTLFFSATWPPKVQHMAQLMCSSELPPVRIMAGQRQDGDGPTSREDILQEVVVFEQPTWEERDSAKQELLYAHLREVLSNESHKTLVFVGRKNLADTLASRLKSEGFRANVMHGGKSQDSRLATLEAFRNGEIQLLVTTDVMGRGLDIPGISHVVCYDMGDIEDYVHRIGRTARGPYGKGHALTFYEYDKKWPNLPRKLVAVLEQSGQEVPPELATLAAGEQPQRKTQGWRSWSQ